MLSFFSVQICTTTIAQFFPSATKSIYFNRTLTEPTSPPRPICSEEDAESSKKLSARYILIGG